MATADSRTLTASVPGSWQPFFVFIAGKLFVLYLMNIEQPAITQSMCVNVFKFASKLQGTSVNNEHFFPPRAELIQVQMNIFVI